jgi:hypothetical protein
VCEQHGAEGHGQEAGDDEDGATPCVFAGAEGGNDLENTGGDRPARNEQHENEGGGTRPGERGDAGGDVDQADDQVRDDVPVGAARERAGQFERRPDEGGYREEDDEGEHRDPGPRERDDADRECEQPSHDE